MIARPAGRDLARRELRNLVIGIANRPELWSHLARHDPEARVYEELLRDQHVAVWLICWMEDHDTGFHDHDLSSGAVAVLEGRIREDRLRVGRTPQTRTFGPGEIFDFEASDIHRVAHAGGGPAVTLHAYSPPLWRMGSYAVAADGTLRRQSISYAEELRPVEEAIA
jgi:predicted metal-dependent enzyme (double-stranded beta helix superfamily)